MNGAPLLEPGSMYRDWARVLGAEYRRLREEVEAGTPSLIRAYGATKPAEFFAVVTELFFEKPIELRREHPALYEEFRQYYPRIQSRLRIGGLTGPNRRNSPRR